MTLQAFWRRHKYCESPYTKYRELYEENCNEIQAYCEWRPKGVSASIERGAVVIIVHINPTTKSYIFEVPEKNPTNRELMNAMLYKRAILVHPCAKRS